MKPGDRVWKAGSIGEIVRVGVTNLEPVSVRWIATGEVTLVPRASIHSSMDVLWIVHPRNMAGDLVQ